MRNARPGMFERTDALETDADLALLVAALGGGPGSSVDPDDGSAGGGDADVAGAADPSLPDAA